TPALIRAFNGLYFHGARTPRKRTVSCERYFYPLDRLVGWNRLYGKSGFLQYQFVIPVAAGGFGFRDILARISASGAGSFLAVLKVLGPSNDNLLSFPIEGYTLALDFRNQPALFPLLDDLDRRVIGYGGRVYLTKDARLSRDAFRQSYPR